MTLAVTTGVAAREWLRDPAAMVTAVEVLAELEAARDKAQRDGS